MWHSEPGELEPGLVVLTDGTAYRINNGGFQHDPFDQVTVGKVDLEIGQQVLGDLTALKAAGTTMSTELVADLSTVRLHNWRDDIAVGAYGLQYEGGSPDGYSTAEAKARREMSDLIKEAVDDGGSVGNRNILDAVFTVRLHVRVRGVDPTLTAHPATAHPATVRPAG